MSTAIDKSAFEKLEQEMVENQDLSMAVEGLKQDVEKEVGGDKTVGHYNIERELDSRARTIESGFSNALAQAKSVTGDSKDFAERRKEDEFQKNMERNAVDSEDMKTLLNINDQYQQLVSRLVLVLKIYRDDRQLLRSGIDLQQTRANESEVMEMTKDLIESQQDSIQAQQTEFKSMAREMTDELVERLDRTLEARDNSSEEQKQLLQEMRETAQELKEARQTPQKQVVETRSTQSSEDTSSNNSGKEVSEQVEEETSDDGGDIDEDLTPTQAELYRLVQDNPQKGVRWYAGKMDQKPRMLKMWRTKIQRTDGYEDFSLE